MHTRGQFLIAGAFRLDLPLILILLAGATSCNSDRSESSVKSAETPPRAQSMPISKPVDDAKAAARQSYINQMREIMRDNGTDGSVTDYDGKLIITAEAFKLKPDRDRFMNLTFGPKYRQSLCTLGFKSVEVKSAVILGDGDEYSLGCKESKEESDTRLAFELRAREQYVAALQADLDNNAQTQGSRVEEQNADLIITASFIKGISPQQMRIRGKAMFVAIVPQRKLPATLVFAGYVSRVIHVTKEF